MQTHRIITTLIAALGVTLTLSACNDTSKSTADRASRTTASLDPRLAAPPTGTPPATLPAEVPVPPAESSPVITGAVEAPAASAETPVAFAKSAASGADSAAATAASEPASTSPASEGKSGIDSAATNPLGTLSPSEQSNAMPMAAHGNNHSSPSLEQGASSQAANAQDAANAEPPK